MIATDALIVGAGPVGLFQVFQLGLLEIGAHVVDSLPGAGGQCAELYADKPIYDIPGLPVCSGRELTDRLLQQIRPFNAGLHFGQEVSTVRKLPGDTGFEVGTSGGASFSVKVLIVAAGAGAFMPRQLKLPGIEAFAGSQLHYRDGDAAQFAGQHLVILGDGDAAMEAALRHAQSSVDKRPATVTLVHRRDEFRALPASVERMRDLCAAGEMRFVAGQPIGFARDGDRLHELQLAVADGSTRALRADALLVLMGLSPRLGPIGGWGLALERRQLLVDTEKFETSTPRIFAVGDINSYAGKKKLIVCGFHEATLAAYAAAAYVHPGRAMPLQYTTTSPRLHELLGVAPL